MPSAPKKTKRGALINPPNDHNSDLIKIVHTQISLAYIRPLRSAPLADHYTKPFDAIALHISSDRDL